MNETQREYISNPSKYRQIIWDYKLKPKEFFNILNGKDKEDQNWLGKKWATARVLENVNYYDAMKIVDISYLRSNWDKVKSRVRNRNIKDGYSYVLQKGTLPVAG